MIYFVNPTSHPNIGDIAIFYATLKFFKNNNFTYKILNSKNYKNYDITKNDTIVLLGGGWLGIYQCSITDFYFKVIDEHRDSKIIFLPSSFFPVTDSFKKIKDINAIIFARDPASFENYKKWFTNSKVYHADDMVFYLDRIDNTEQYIKKNIGIFNRNDVESEKENTLKIVNVPDSSFGRSRILPRWIPFEDKLEIYEDLVYRFMFEMTQYKMIVTDSLHVSIFSYLIRRKCYILDNKYKKVTNTWKKYKCDSVICFTHDMNENAVVFNDIEKSFSKIKESLK